MKKLTILTLSLLSLFSFAGRFSELDLVVREAVALKYDLNPGELSNLELQSSDDKDCLFYVTGQISETESFVTCITKGEYGYEAEVIED